MSVTQEGQQDPKVSSGLARVRDRPRAQDVAGSARLKGQRSETTQVVCPSCEQRQTC